MRQDEDRLLPLLAASVTLLLILSAGLIHYLPRDLAAVAVSWAMLSVSVGIGFGHCVRNEP